MFLSQHGQSTLKNGNLNSNSMTTKQTSSPLDDQKLLNGPCGVIVLSTTVAMVKN